MELSGESVIRHSYSNRSPIKKKYTIQYFCYLEWSVRRSSKRFFSPNQEYETTIENTKRSKVLQTVSNRHFASQSIKKFATSSSWNRLHEVCWTHYRRPHEPSDIVRHLTAQMVVFDRLQTRILSKKMFYLQNTERLVLTYFTWLLLGNKIGGRQCFVC